MNFFVAISPLFFFIINTAVYAENETFWEDFSKTKTTFENENIPDRGPNYTAKLKKSKFSRIFLKRLGFFLYF